MVMFDSLNKDKLSAYGCDWIKTPNFDRLKEKTMRFDRNYVGSLPCMPARRELHTGRYNFLHRSWGPLEPFDVSMPQLLKENGVYTHLTTDHNHYWEDGGATYHGRYTSYTFHRGQEGDRWKVSPEHIKATREGVDGRTLCQHIDHANRKYIRTREELPQHKTFQDGLEFIEENHIMDDWFLQIESFDPHEPFFTLDMLKEVYGYEADGSKGDWPEYYIVDESKEEVKNTRMLYAALVTQCDYYLGKVLDKMDEHNMWEDTMLIVNTDHGYLLGEHDWWAKNNQPVYNEIANTPLFVYDPVCKKQGVSCDKLTQHIDLAPTLLDFFNVDIPKEVLGKSLLDVIRNDMKIHDCVLFGDFRGNINITDGEWVYMKAPIKGVNFEYTLAPMHMNFLFSPEELEGMELVDGFDFTKGVKLLKIRSTQSSNNFINFGNKLFNVLEDPNQTLEISNIEKELELVQEMKKLMKLNDAPYDKYERFAIPEHRDITKEDIIESQKACYEYRIPNDLNDVKWTKAAVNTYNSAVPYLLEAKVNYQNESLKKRISNNIIEAEDVLKWTISLMPEDKHGEVEYFLKMAMRTN